jgi:nocturnin
MLEEIARHDPDIVCLQEVDHFPFLQNALSNLGYSGHFKPKPDSPCLHLSGNTGPDGCAIFYKTDKFELKKLESRVLEIWGVPSNQVAMSLMLETRSTGSQLVVSTTHLKARKGPLLSALRNEQARDLLDHLTRFADGKPVICTGDFNAEPDEPVYTTMTHPDELGLSSAYASVHGGKEYDYTSWKIRGEEECKEILDYIFYSEQGFQVEAVLEPVAEDEIGIDRLPNLAFASDHLSLVTDLKILVPEINNQNF